MLKGKYIELIPYDEKYIDYIYNKIVIDVIEGMERFKMTQKKDLYEFLNNKRKDIKVFIKKISSQEIIGYITSYNYNKIDSYIYITSILENDEKFNKEAITLFITHLFKYFPIRKIYCEIADNHLNKVKLFNELGFKNEACLEKDVFFNGSYYNKNILSLYREDYKYE